MKADVLPPPGSFQDIQRQVQDVVSSVLMANTFEPNYEVLKALVTGQVQEQLKPMARKVGAGDGSVNVVLDDGPEARDRMERGELSGHVDIGISFYFTLKPETTGDVG